MGQIKDYYVHRGYPEDYAAYYGYDYDEVQPEKTCQHEWVNVSFNLLTLACKHCGQDKPE